MFPRQLQMGWKAEEQRFLAQGCCKLVGELWNNRTIIGGSLPSIPHQMPTKTRLDSKDPVTASVIGLKMCFMF